MTQTEAPASADAPDAPKAPAPTKPAITVRTNRVWSEFSCRDDVPPEALAEFDWLDATEDGGFMCHGIEWYHISQFTRLEGSGGLARAWSAALAFTVWSGMVIRVSRDGERYQIGYFFQ